MTMSGQRQHDDGQNEGPADDRRSQGSGGADSDAGVRCGACGNELSVIRIEVDGNTLMMESCDGCDSRRWQLAGERIDLQKALDEVGEHAGRRR